MAESTSFDPDELMALAVAAMQGSEPERRDDDKEVLRVGAVIWRPGEAPVHACRGELRQGDHAEYTLLERKLGDAALDDAVLFSTLEPCAPGAR